MRTHPSHTKSSDDRITTHFFVSALILGVFLTTPAMVEAQAHPAVQRPEELNSENFNRPQDIRPQPMPTYSLPEQTFGTQAQQERFFAQFFGVASIISGVTLFAITGATFVDRSINGGQHDRVVMGRNVTLNSLGAGVIGGAAMVAQGATLLLRNSEEARARAPYKDGIPLYFHTGLSDVEADAREGRERRRTRAILWMTFAPIGGGVVGGFPTSKIDRGVLVAAGSTIALTGLGIGLYHLVTKSPEERLLKELEETRPGAPPLSAEEDDD